MKELIKMTSDRKIKRKTILLFFTSQEHNRGPHKDLI